MGARHSSVIGILTFTKGANLTETKEIIYKGYKTGRFVGTDGLIYKQDGTVCKTYDNGNGYLLVPFYIKGLPREKNRMREYVHRAVATAFLDNPLGYKQVNHKDCNKENNAVDNLEWISNSANVKHGYDKGRMYVHETFGTDNMLPYDEVVFCYTKVILDGKGISETAREMGKARTTIANIINKRSRRDITNKLDEQFSTKPLDTPINHR